MEDPSIHSPSSFSSFSSYFRALKQTPKRLARRAASVSTSYDELTRVRALSGPNMTRSLRWYDLIGLGVGGMVGAGVFVTAGQASLTYAGPAVIVSYAIAGLCALLSAFCYTEFAVDIPVAGGAFTYLRVTFGEFAAFITGANLVLDYVLSNAAVARSFTAYFGTAVGISTSKWRFIISPLPKGFNEIDVIAVLVILIITLVICYSTRESSVVNMLLTMAHLLFIGFIIVIGFCKGDTKNLTHPENPTKPGGFFPFGLTGVFNGAAMVYLSFIGYDAVSTMAEEVKKSRKRYTDRCFGFGNIGHCSLLLDGYFYVLAPPIRRRLLTATIALFTDLGILLNLVSIGTLFVFYMVGNAVIYRRYVTPGTTNPRPTLSFLFLLSLTSTMFTIVWHLAPLGNLKDVMLGVCAVAAIALLQLFQCLVPQAKKPEFWGVPLMPWLPSLSIFLNIFLLGSLDAPSYIRFGFFSALSIAVYVLYSVHASFDAEGNGSMSHKTDEMLLNDQETGGIRTVIV